MPTPDQKKKLLKATIAVALHNELGRVPKQEEIDQVFLLTRVMYQAILGLLSIAVLISEGPDYRGLISSPGASLAAPAVL